MELQNLIYNLSLCILHNYHGKDLTVKIFALAVKVVSNKLLSGEIKLAH